ncbi:transglycosylase domain-containing protein [Terriglobus aquaticus]|uniref:Transglycosylase domain-containing protein n=1 Tax=Terriglobus aquaticus TaxID=940139 RepID=A0ABW9KMF8_9BACT|nr:transglycosylase domain-containing protein [Terriglobus aquaticus]
MAVKVRLGNSGRYDQGSMRGVRRGRPLWQRAMLFLGAVALVFAVIGGVIYAYYYHQYEQIVDERLAAGPLFVSTSQIYAAPREIRPGQHFTVEQIAQDLRKAGYNVNQRMGTYQLLAGSISIKPGPASFHSPDGATITDDGTSIAKITADNGVELRSYELEPQLITGLSEDKNRTKRRLITYSQIPKVLVQAVTAIEDRRFFEHGGVNFYRLAGCAVEDAVSGKKECGGSTLTMQLARGFFLSPKKDITRKLREIMITLQLESRFSKEQIFEMYANQINLGQRGSFAINGFGEAAQAYFGKDVTRLNVAEAAMLAGLIQRPNYFNPFRHPERMLERRNVVLKSMIETGALTEAQSEAAQAEPLHLVPQNIDANEAPYFVDLVHDQLNSRLGDTTQSGTLRIYTSLDPDLQRAASEAVDVGMRQVDEEVRRLHHGEANFPMPQVALVALNPHTGQVLALVGGRNYGQSQLNHATSKRPTGSIFKPFVYATAEMDTVRGQQIGSTVDDEGNQTGGGMFTAVTPLSDVPTTFTYDNGRSTYTPRNFKGAFHGTVTAIYALAHSLNNATVSLGQQVGFENVAALGRASGVVTAKGTPAVALGAYDATPLDMAGAYTVFANGGVHITPWMLKAVRNDKADIVADFTPEASQVMDPKAAYLTQSLLQGVMDFGYGVAVRQRGFKAPAAGKTGTSHDAWFAAYSSNLLCVVWVGNDDYTDIKLTGAVAAAPIWAEFMNRAARLPQYSDMQSFTAPDGITSVKLDKVTNLLADETCPNDYVAAFLEGTQPQSTCSRMGGNTNNLGDLLGSFDGAGGGTRAPDGAPSPNPPNSLPDGTPGEPQDRKHRNFFQKLFGGGGDDRRDRQSAPPDPQ